MKDELEQLEQFERLLKEAPVRTHSSGLKERLLPPARRRAPVLELLRRPIPAGWAAAAAIAMGVLGASADRLWPGRPAPSRTQRSVEVRIVEASAPGHDFDLTGVAPAFFTGDVTVEVELQKEI